MQGMPGDMVSTRNLAFGDFIIVPNDERLVGPAGPVRLGNKAYRVLLMLAERRGQLLTKDELFASVWDGTIVSESALTSVIKELRRALGDESRTPRYIESVYGRGYRLLQEVSEQASPDRPDLSRTPDPAMREMGGAPSIAVLPIASRSGSPAEDDLAADLSDELIASLSQNGYFRVVAGGTVAAWRDKAADYRLIARELGTRYLVEAILRRTGAELRLTVHLVDAETSNILWSSRYARPLPDPACHPDDLTIEIANDIGDAILRIELEQAARKTEGWSAWERVLRAMACFLRMGLASGRTAIAEAREAVSIAPAFGLGHAMLAAGIAVDFFMAGGDAETVEREVRRRIKTALDLDGDNPNLLNIVAGASRCIGDAVANLRYAERAVQLAPDIANCHYRLAQAYVGLGRIEEAFAEFDAEERLAPHSTLRYLSLHARALAHLARGEAEPALAALDRSLGLNPNFVLSLKWRAIVAAMLGRADEARDAIRRMREAEPALSLTQHEDQIARALADQGRAAAVNRIFRQVWDDAPAETPAPAQVRTPVS